MKDMWSLPPVSGTPGMSSSMCPVISTGMFENQRPKWAPAPVKPCMRM